MKSSRIRSNLSFILMEKSRTRCVIVLLLIVILLSIANLTAGNNLPNTRKEVSITGRDHRQLKAFFGPFNTTTSSLDGKTERILLNRFPPEFKTGCQGMISQWGAAVRGSGSSAIRVLHIHHPQKDLQQLFLVYTCFSSAEGYGDKYYDERLALLTIDSTASRLTMLPHTQPCDTCTDLTKIGIDENDIMIGDLPAISVIYGSSSKNPCCTNPLTRDEVMIKYFLMDPKGVREMLSIVRERKEVYRNDVLGDSTTTYTTDLSVEKDTKGNLSRITVNYEQSDGNRMTNGVVWYTWNRKAKRFEEGKR